MKKMFKTVASLALGCALLSTSAFAALDGTVSYSENTIGANITLDSAQSTVLVLKGAKTAMPASIADSDIAYINQETVSNGAVTYSMPVDGTTAYTVFAGGTNESAAKLLGVVNFAIIATATEVDENATITLTTNAGEGTAVAWESDNTAVATVNAGVVTGVKAGSANITAKIMNGDDVLASATQAITVKAVAPAGDYFDINGVNGETKKATVTTVKKATVGESLWIFNGYSERHIIDLDKSYDATASTVEKEETITYKNYTLSVVTDDADANVIANALVYYARENNKWVVLIPDGVTSYKFQITAGENSNSVLGKFGDVTGDGKIMAGDYNLVKRSVNGFTTGNATTSVVNALRADVSADGKLMAGDYNLIKRCVNGLSYSFPAAK